MSLRRQEQEEEEEKKENNVNQAIDNNDECLTVGFALVDLYPLYNSTYRHENEIKNASSNHVIKRKNIYISTKNKVCSFFAFLSSICQEIGFAIGAFLSFHISLSLCPVDFVIGFHNIE